MAQIQSDAFVFFGATGDLAYKKIFPALYTMVRRDGLDILIIGMARPGWSLDKLKQRARDSVEHDGNFEAACSRSSRRNCATSAATTRIPPPSRS